MVILAILALVPVFTHMHSNMLVKMFAMDGYWPADRRNCSLYPKLPGGSLFNLLLRDNINGPRLLARVHQVVRIAQVELDPNLTGSC